MIDQEHDRTPSSRPCTSATRSTPAPCLLIEVDGLRGGRPRGRRRRRAPICERLGAREVRDGRRPQPTASASGRAARARSARSAGSRPTTTSSTASCRARKLPEVLRGVYEACERYGFPVANVFHAGDGNLHPNILFDERVPGETERVLDAGEEIMRLCVDAGGSITGEHGVGLREARLHVAGSSREDDLDAMAAPQGRLRRRRALQPLQGLPDLEGLRRSLLAHASRRRESRPRTPTSERWRNQAAR